MWLSDVKEYDTAHGSPFDRGSADSWYDRSESPHYFLENGDRITIAKMTAEQIEAYKAGYAWNERWGGKKEWV